MDNLILIQVNFINYSFFVHDLVIYPENEEKKRKKRNHKKKKHNHKKKKRQRKYEAKISAEEENRVNQLTSTTIEQSTEMSCQDIVSLKTTIDFDLLFKIPTQAFAIERNLNDNNDDINRNNDRSINRYGNDLVDIFYYEYYPFSTTDYHLLKIIDSSGRSIKGRGFMVSYQVFCLFYFNICFPK